jgi:16S rRNA (guanine966-N2)-methyltransferase
MRVIAGSWRGRRLSAPTGIDMRPTTDRVKEAMFSILGTRIGGAEVADLCCGCGGLGIEALSRGAWHVHFVDLAAAALRQARRNLAACGAAGETFTLSRSEASRWLRQRFERLGERPLIVLADPPYADKLGEVLWELLLGISAEGGLAAAILECPRALSLPVPERSSFRIRRRHYGASALMIMEA